MGRNIGPEPKTRIRAIFHICLGAFVFFMTTAFGEIDPACIVVAQVLTDMLGSMAFTDYTHNGNNFAPRSFDSFFEFADEAAISRLYGGVHYRSAIEKGVVQGKCIGQKISALKFRK